jgi:hypothetical protein
MTRSDSNHPVEALSAYLDGELSPAEAAELELHLRGCSECGLMLEDLRLLSRAAGEELPPPLPADLATRIARRLAPGRGEKGARRSGWLTGFFGAPLAAAAAALLAAGVLWVVWQGRSMTIPPPPETVGREAVEQEERPESRLASKADKKAATLVADAAPADDRTEGPGPPPKRKLSPKGPAAAGARAGGIQERSARQAPAPSMLDEDAGAGLAGQAEPLEGRDTSPPAYAPAPATVDEDATAKTAMPIEPFETEESGPPAYASATAAEPEKGGVAAPVEGESAGRLGGSGYAPPPEADATRPSAEATEKRERELSALALNFAAPEETHRDLVLHEPGYEIRLTPSGAMTVIAGEYLCSVSPDPIMSAAANDLFAGEAASEADGGPVSGKERADSALSRPGFQEAAVSGPARIQSDRQRRLLLELVRGPYREAMERKCGPLPGTLVEDLEP